MKSEIQSKFTTTFRRLFFTLTLGALIYLGSGTIGPIKDKVQVEANSHCNFVLSPGPYNTNSTITITVNDQNSATYFIVKLFDNYNDPYGSLITQTQNQATVQGDTLVFTFDLSTLDPSDLTDITSELIIQTTTQNPGGTCRTNTGTITGYPITVQSPGPVPGNCSFSINPSSGILISTSITFQITNFPGADGSYTVKAFRNSEASPSWQTTITISGGSSSPFSNTFSQNGSYDLLVFDSSGSYVSSCETSFTVNSPVVPSPSPATGPVLVPGTNPCGPTGADCPTALGNIPTDAAAFAGKILSIAIGLAGGIALILMVIGSIRVLTSSGDQQRLSAGRDMIVAAVAGLLFLIFSVLILRFIGVNILGLQA